jgi:UTP--glucose-1-phosphate uridylyltransferase
MSDSGLALARRKMEAAGVDPVAIEVFATCYRRVEGGESGVVVESSIEPLQMDALDDQLVSQENVREALARTVVLKLNGGLGTSMGISGAKSLLPIRAGLTFLDVIARQVLSMRERCGARLPLVLMNSFRTRTDTLAALSAYPELRSDLPLDFLQNKEPKLRADDLTPVSWPTQPDLEWCPPGHGDLYPAMYGAGLLGAMLDAGYSQVFVSNCDNLGAVPSAAVAGWFAQSGAPFAVEAVRRTPSDRKGGHFAVRKSDRRIVLRETAQTTPQDLEALSDLTRHRFASTNNIWFDVAAMKAVLDAQRGVLKLPLIQNRKTVDPSDPTSPQVIQIETAMGAAIELFAEATTIEVGRERFIPVKTTNDLLVLRSDCYRLDDDAVLHQISRQIPFVDLGPSYKLVGELDARFPNGVPSLCDASSLMVSGDWTFGSSVRVVGRVSVTGEGGYIPPGTTLGT